ncbi:leucine-rich repeat-containing protein 63 isoform X1 [Petaurus breviceps papuanus]|uniref:leucine-rich repeat-containing protein 63 isoform X1 n=1 Tax=Petaurus breviceps papuanus TaxID=3040969 RepID=UPI0036DBDF8A
MLTLPKLLRRPLPPKTHNKPLQLKKEKIKSVSKEQDLLKPCPRKIIPTEIEKNIIPGKFPKRRRQSRVHIKNLLLKWHIKKHRDSVSKMFLKRYPKSYVLFSNIKDNYDGPFDLSAFNSIKEESSSETSSLQHKIRSYFLDSALEKNSSMSSETSTPTSSQLGHSSSFTKSDLERVTTPDSTYMPYIISPRFTVENKNSSKKGKENWYDKLLVTHDTIHKHNFSFGGLSAALPRRPYRQYMLENTKREEKKPERKESAPSEKILHFTELAEEMTESEEELIVYGEGYYKDSLLEPSDDPKMNLARIAVIRCHEHGRNALSFKGFFIERCPDLSILTNQLVYLNLAFNSLSVFPPEVLILINLQVLIMRNNPIKEISPDIDALKKLKIFVISFNLLTSLPTGLFSLSELEFLDVSYNEITSIPNEIKYLSTNLCDYCQGPLYGKGLHLIRPFDVFNNSLLPILFNVCSPRCFKYTWCDTDILNLLTR